MVSVRRSGRLSKPRKPNRATEEYETIDLTLDDSENEQGIVSISWYYVSLLKNKGFLIIGL